MRIFILVDCYLPSRKSGAKHIHDLAVEFRRQGHEVTVLAPSDSIGQDMQVRTEEGLRIVRARTGRIKCASKPLRAIREYRLSSVLWRRGRRFLAANRSDLILFYSPTIFFGPLVRRLKSLWRCPSYLILRDIFPQWAVDTGVLRKGLTGRFFRRAEIGQYDVADVIAVQSHGDLEYFRKNFSQKMYRLEVLYNWANLREAALPSTAYRDNLGLLDKVVFFYGGNLGVAQDVDNLLRLAASLAPHPYVHFLLVGGGSEVARMKRAVISRGLRNVQFLPDVGQREYLAMLAEFDVGLLSLDQRLTTHNIPGKVLGYMYWSMPILASVNPGNDLFDLIGRYRAGFCFRNGDDENLAAAALRLADDANLRSRMGRNSRRLLEDIFSVEDAARKVMEHISKPVHGVEPAKPVLAARM